ncbi:hypothetical protein [Paenibacillus sp. IHB B 3415]|nr:hypothetical protein [Paenibacillus sp. IHB B 3415]
MNVNTLTKLSLQLQKGKKAKKKTNAPFVLKGGISFSFHIL